MKLNCLRTDIVQAVTNVQRAVSAKSTMPALEGILLKVYDGKINLSAYDLEIGITTDIEATILEQGEIVLSAKLFSDILRKLPEEIITIETDERMITYITSGQVEFQIIGMSAVEFPDLPVFEANDTIKISSSVLKDMIRQTVYAVSDNKEKPIYTGSLFEIEDKKLRIVAVDGYRMAIREEAVDCDSKTDFVVPGKTQNEVLKLITEEEKEVEILIGQRHVSFNIDGYSVISRLIEGTFLNYRATIPNESVCELVINTKRMMSAVERMSLMTNEKIKSPVRCAIGRDEIKISCITTVGKASDSVPITATGEEMEIGFNNRYLIDALRYCDTDEVKFILGSGFKPMLIKPIKGESFLFVVGPMRLSNDY